jgi:dihydrofolate reductase
LLSDRSPGQAAQLKAVRRNKIGGIVIKGSVFVGMSLDGFIARTDGRVDFLSPSGDVPHGYEEFVAKVESLVMGRNTYEFVVDFGEWPYGDKPVFVLSSAGIKPPPDAIVERMHGDPKEIASEIASRGISHIYVDGGVTIQEFLRAGLIQRLVISRVPVLIGSGIPLFGDLDHDILLRHVSTRHFASGLVQSEYEVAG